MIDRCDDIRTGLSKDENAYGGSTVRHSKGPSILDRISDVRDIAKSNRSSIPIGYEQRFKFTRCHQLIRCVEGPVYVPFVEHPLGAVRIGATDGSTHIFETNFVLIEDRRVQFHSYGGRGPTRYKDLPYTCNLR